MIYLSSAGPVAMPPGPEHGWGVGGGVAADADGGWRLPLLTPAARATAAAGPGTALYLQSTLPCMLGVPFLPKVAADL